MLGSSIKSPTWAQKALEQLNPEEIAAGFHPAARMDIINATALGSAQDQTVGLLVFSRAVATPHAIIVPPARPTALLHVLRSERDVPKDCSVTGLLEAWPHRSAWRTSPTVVGRLLMGGDHALLFKGLMVKLSGSPMRWRVKTVEDDETLELVACRGAERRTTKISEVSKHLPQWAQVASLHGTAFAVAVAGKGPAGAGNTLVLDDRSSPQVRALFFDEVGRL